MPIRERRDQLRDSTGAKRTELDLRPGEHNLHGIQHRRSELPYWIAVKGSDTAYIASVRDRKIVVVSPSAAPAVAGAASFCRFKKLLFSTQRKPGSTSPANSSDEVVVIDTGTGTGRVLQRVKTAAAPPGRLTAVLPGASPEQLWAFSPDGKNLYVTNGGTDSIAGSDGGITRAAAGCRVEIPTR